MPNTTIRPIYPTTVVQTATGETVIQQTPFAVTTIDGGVGPQGPPGPPGGGSYQHTQSTPASTWVVNHNLGFRPDVTVFSPGGIEVEAEIAHISTTQTEIRFSAAATGSARFI